MNGMPQMNGMQGGGMQQGMQQGMQMGGMVNARK